MTKSKLLIISLIVLISVLGLGASATNSTIFPRIPTQEPDKPKQWQTLTPFDEAAEVSDPHERDLRDTKNRRYNSRRSNQVLVDQPLDAVYGRIDETHRPTALPIAQSAAAILGAVTRVQPYLSQDKKVIYTEFDIRIEEVFKNELSTSIASGSVTTVSQEGGAIRLRNGRVLRYLVGGASNLPKLGGRYVLFLSLIHDDKDLSILTGYELRDGFVSSLEEGGNSQYAGCSEASFLELIRRAGLSGSSEDLNTTGGAR